MSDTPFRSTRRTFLATSAAGLVAAPRLVTAAGQAEPDSRPVDRGDNHPVLAISSANGTRATRRAYELIVKGTDVLDAVVAGVNIVEDDPEDMSVGYGGLPNENCVVQLDSAVMHGPTHQAGAVACLENIRNPSKVARLVLWTTDHVLLVGQGALNFAKQNGFLEENLLTERARKIWLRWKQSLSDQDDWLTPPEGGPKEVEGEDRSGDGQDDDANARRTNDDEERLIASVLRDRPTGTIHCSGMDRDGNISCVTTTSGLAFKIPGRVGDSPIIGAGLYVDNEIGSCGSTGRGEANLQNQCCFAAVELMRGGRTPEEAGMEVLRRVAKHTVPRLRNEKGEPDFGLMFYLLRKDGLHAGVSLRGDRGYAITDAAGTRTEKCNTLF